MAPQSRCLWCSHPSVSKPPKWKSASVPQHLGCVEPWPDVAQGHQTCKDTGCNAASSLPPAKCFHVTDSWCGAAADQQGYQQSYDAALVGADRSKDIVVLRPLNLQVGCAQLHGHQSLQSRSMYRHDYTLVLNSIEEFVLQSEDSV